MTQYFPGFREAPYQGGNMHLVVPKLSEMVVKLSAENVSSFCTIKIVGPHHLGDVSPLSFHLLFWVQLVIGLGWVEIFYPGTRVPITRGYPSTRYHSILGMSTVRKYTFKRHFLIKYAVCTFSISSLYLHHHIYAP